MKEGRARTGEDGRGRRYRFVVSGGGTGGHLVPGIELARELCRRGHSVHFLRSGRRAEEPFVEACDGLAFQSLPLAPGRLGPRLGLPLALYRAYRRARRYLADTQTDLVVGLGGRGALPACLAAVRSKLPFVLLEQNVVPGKTNRLLGRFARRCYTAFPDTGQAMGRAELRPLGMPLREGFGQAADPQLLNRLGYPEFRARDGFCKGGAREGARADEETIDLLIVGGSQGALPLNTQLPELLARLPEKLRARLRILHLCGRDRVQEALRPYARSGLQVVIRDFCSNMAGLYAQADLIICRGGAMTLLEIAAAGRPAIVVPYAHHRDDHQGRNAQWYVERGSVRLIREAEISSDVGLAQIEQVLADAELRSRMGHWGQETVRANAAASIADDLQSLLLDDAAASMLDGQLAESEPRSESPMRRRKDVG